MFNLQPGQGLGFTGSKEIALGLGGYAVAVIILPGEVPAVSRPGGGAGVGRGLRKREEREIREIMVIIVKSGILN